MTQAVPFNRVLGVQFIAVEAERAEAMLPEAPERLNHVGTMHAVAQFGLGEATSGAMVLAAFTDLQGEGYIPLAASAQITYRKPLEAIYAPWHAFRRRAGARPRGGGDQRQGALQRAGSDARRAGRRDHRDHRRVGAHQAARLVAQTCIAGYRRTTCRVCCRNDPDDCELQGERQCQRQ